ncbi:acyl-CoA dehydrogenase [Streptomyces sp. NPDC008150]|uniref:acyl-CoA dehydrogenase n=1 Tax=Streptomyces sp. NPDC008150 TaxID=3364816 RepID=UPI0036E5476E
MSDSALSLSTPLAPEGPGRAGGEADGNGSETTDTRALREATARRFAAVAEQITTGRRPVPLPGSGGTAQRLSVLQAVAEEDLAVARLVEGHVDALAILAELRGPAAGSGERWAVWAAEPPGAGLRAVREGDGWRLDGTKKYCSGAHSCTHALVTADTDDGKRLFAAEIAGAGNAPGTAESAGAVGDARGVPRAGGTCRPVPGTWPAVGMAGSDSPDVEFRGVRAVPVGEVGAYVARPGFQHGGIGVAACWYGGAVAVAGTLRTAAARGADPHRDAHFGAVDVLLNAAAAVLGEAAAEIDADPADASGGARVRTLRVRAFVESVCAEVLARVGRATGAGPLCHDARHARAASDLAVYIRQHHAERDLAELGALVARPGAGR